MYYPSIFCVIKKSFAMLSKPCMICWPLNMNELWAPELTQYNKPKMNYTINFMVSVLKGCITAMQGFQK